MDLLEVSAHPVTFILKHLPLEKEAVSKAFVFLGITLLLTYLLGIPMLPKQSNHLYMLLLYSAASGVAFLGGMLLFRAAWSIVGGRASIRELFVCAAYLSAPPLFIISFFSLVGQAFFILIDPEGAAALRENPMAELSESSEELGGQIASQALTIFGLAVALCWYIGAWRSYRIINRVSKIRSIIAFFLSVVFSIPFFFLVTLFVFPLISEKFT